MSITSDPAVGAQPAAATPASSDSPEPEAKLELPPAKLHLRYARLSDSDDPALQPDEPQQS